MSLVLTTCQTLLLGMRPEYSQYTVSKDDGDNPVVEDLKKVNKWFRSI